MSGILFILHINLSTYLTTYINYHIKLGVFAGMLNVWLWLWLMATEMLLKFEPFSNDLRIARVTYGSFRVRTQRTADGSPSLV